MPTLLPKPPPMSPAMIRILCSGMPATMAYRVRWACGAIADYDPIDGKLTLYETTQAPHVSIGAGCTRG
jgi:hypothetical protein